MVSFGGDGSNQSQELQSKVEIHSKSIVSVVERQKDLENKIDIIDEKIELLDHNSIREIKKVANDIKHLRDEIHDIKADMEEIKEFQLKVKKQFKISVTKDEVKKLERYIDLWNPMQFATREELLDLKESIISHLKTDIENFLYENNGNEINRDKKNETKNEKKSHSSNSKNNTVSTSFS